MRLTAKSVALVVLFVLSPGLAFAQAVIAGVVKDASGAILPGVTVEASSPALIEKVRTAVTDGTGQYPIENLRPGTYSVTFSLSGFGGHVAAADHDPYRPHGQVQRRIHVLPCTVGSGFSRT
jgi:hypothetical protein